MCEVRDEGLGRRGRGEGVSQMCYVNYLNTASYCTVGTVQVYILFLVLILLAMEFSASQENYIFND